LPSRAFKETKKKKNGKGGALRRAATSCLSNNKLSPSGVKAYQAAVNISHLHICSLSGRKPEAE